MKTESPYILRILDALLPPDLDHLVGDLEEEYRNRMIDRGGTNARLHLWFQVMRTLPYFLFQSLIWNINMLKNYITVTWRNIKKHKSYSLINIFGLSLSMAVCLLIIVFIVDQKSYDRFHQNSDRIYRVTSDFKSSHNRSSSMYATSPANLANILQQRVPGISKTSKINGSFGGELRYKDKTIPVEGFYADSSFFDLFSFELVKGNPKTALKDPASIVLTRESARKIFGQEDPIGKFITNLDDRDYRVTGIIESGMNTHFMFNVNEAIVSYATLENNKETRERLNQWNISIFTSYTYLLLDEKTDPASIEQRLVPIIKNQYQDPEEDDIITSFHLQPITNIMLGPMMSNQLGIALPNVIGWFLAAFAGIIILIACFNYVSLTVARSLKRTREVGVRKVMGAYRSNVVTQFLAESIIIAFIALILASLLLRWLLPEFNSLHMINITKNQISSNVFEYPILYLFVMSFSIFVGMMAGLYPALYLSSFSPARVLKGITSVRGLSGQTLKKVITVAQFSFSVIFIITALVLAKQFNHLMNTDYGFDREGIVNIALQDVSYDRLKPALEQLPEVNQVAATSHIPALGQTYGVWLNSDSVSQKVRGHSFIVDEQYIQTTGLNLMTGRNFNPERAKDSTSSVIISEVAVKQLGLDDNRKAIGKTITVDGNNHEVIGVIRNFVSANPFQTGNPIVLLYTPSRTNYAIVKTKEKSLMPFLEKLDETWAGIGSLHSLKYEILNDQLQENPLLLLFNDFIKIIGLISLFAVFISCLGLLGMALYSAENRVKEIGIRKVLGASVQHIVYLLSKEYMVLILIAVAIGTPVAWIANRLWLQQISNKIQLGPWIMITGIAGMVLLAAFTVGSQALRAARANSIDNLRDE